MSKLKALQNTKQQMLILFVEHDKTFCDRIATKVVPL